MKLIWFGVLLIVHHLISECQSARILGIFPTPSISHQIVFHALMKDLANRGHQLTILTTDLIQIQNPNVTQIDLHDSYDVLNKELNFVDIKNRKLDEEDFMTVALPILIKIVDKQLGQPDVKKIIENKDNQTFDVVIIEYLNYISPLAFAEVYDCPVIGITSMDTWIILHEAIGNVANPVIHPEFIFPFNHGQLTFYERWRSLKYYFRINFLWNTEYNSIHLAQIRNHFPAVKSSLENLKERVQLMMLNTHPAMGFIRPLLPNTIQLGFMHIEPPKPLSDDVLKTFLDNSDAGVIYMSLGSNVKSKDLSPEILEIFLNVFGNMSFNVLWKFEADNLPNKPDNVMISKWFPQSDLLAHPAIKLFITQGGQQSMEEAIDRTIPMIIIPFLGDQDANAKRMVKKVIGYHLELHSLTQRRLVEAVNEMVNKPWHIPRASLGGSTSSQSGSQISTSISSSVKYPGKNRGYKNRGYHSEGNDSSTENERKKRKTITNCRKVRDIDKNPDGNSDETNDGIKRGSQSSQGSTDSNHSSHSASSGSLLLTAANLEQLAQIHKKNPLTHHQFYNNDYHTTQQQQQNHRLYNTNITLNSIDASSRLPSGMMHRINEDTIIPVGIDSNQIKTKDLDTMSMASSTHFTVVNGMGGPQRVAKDGLCSRGHQITVLILTMSLMFLIGIAAAVFMLEMRAKKMPH